MSQPGMISHGLPTRGPDVDAHRAIAELQRQINQMHGVLVQATNTANMAAATANSALEQIASYSFYGQSFNPDPSSSRYAINGSVSVPTGFTKLAFFGTCAISAINNTGTADTLQPYPQVGYPGAFVIPNGFVTQGAPAGSRAAVTQGISGVMTGLTTGQTIQVQAYALTSYGTWTSQSFANFNILMIWQP